MSIRDTMIEYGESYEAAVERLAEQGDLLRKQAKENPTERIDMATQEKPALESDAPPEITIVVDERDIVYADDAPEVLLNNVVMRWCPHCLTVTTQVGELPDGWPEESPETPKIVKKPGHCLQCIADGGDCCDLAAFSRWPAEEEDEQL